MVKLPKPVAPVAMRVLALGYNYNQDARSMVQPRDFEPVNFARVMFAVKDGGELSFGGYTPRTVGSRNFVIGKGHSAEHNAREAAALCLAMIHETDWDSADLGVDSPSILVPVPSRDAVVGAGDPKRWGPRDLARGVAAEGHFYELVRFKDPPPKSAKEGGPRNPYVLLNHLELVADPPEDTNSAIIVDDVLTSGGHMQAVAMLLARDTHLTQFAGLCIGETVGEPVDDPWEHHIVELDPTDRNPFADFDD